MRLRARNDSARRRISRLVASNLDDIRRAAQAAEAEVDRSAPARVYVFWAQSIETAPEVVQMCRRQLQRLHAPEELAVLDLAAARELVHIPPDVLPKIQDDLPMLSDVLRLAILSRYGGAWTDATCLATDNLLDRSRALLGSGFFAFTREDRPLASWFLASEPGDYIVRMWREAMYAYWRHFDHKLHYYLVHHLFEALLRHDAEFRRRWDATPRLAADPPHVFQMAMREPYDEARYRELLGASFIHKLTYKVQPQDMTEATLLGHLLRDGAPSA